MEKIYLYIISSIIILGIASALIISQNSPGSVPPSTIGGNTISSGEVQKITLSLKNGNYYPNTLNVKAGTPVELTLDDSVVGCYRSFNIRTLGVSAVSSSPSQKITFSATTPGEYAFACSMGMGFGKLIVG